MITQDTRWAWRREDFKGFDPYDVYEKNPIDFRRLDCVQREFKVRNAFSAVAEDDFSSTDVSDKDSLKSS